MQLCFVVLNALCFLLFLHLVLYPKDWRNERRQRWFCLNWSWNKQKTLCFSLSCLMVDMSLAWEGYHQHLINKLIKLKQCWTVLKKVIQHFSCVKPVLLLVASFKNLMDAFVFEEVIKNRSSTKLTELRNSTCLFAWLIPKGPSL